MDTDLTFARAVANVALTQWREAVIADSGDAEHEAGVRLASALVELLAILDDDDE
jgi:hypothetical protein